MKSETVRQLKDLIETYDRVMKVMEHDAAEAMKRDSRAYGGFVRATKGKIQEFLTEKIVRIAWDVELHRPPARLAINSKKIRIPIQMQYVQRLKDRAVRNYVLGNIKKFYYGLSVDKHVFIDGKLVLGVECKAYTENAMLKRILVDFHLLKTKAPDMLCYLFQLESQLGGDYSAGKRNPRGSTSSHTLMSCSPSCSATRRGCCPASVNETVATLPISLGSIGLAEGSYVVYFGLLGLGRELTLAVGLLLRMKALLLGLIGLVVQMREPVNVASAKEMRAAEQEGA